MKHITTQWLSLDYPDNCNATQQRADVVLVNSDTKSTLSITALRSFDDYPHTEESMKSYAGGDPSISTYEVEEIYIEDCRCYFCSLSEVRFRCVFLRDKTMIILFVEGASFEDALETFSETYRNLTVIKNN